MSKKYAIWDKKSQVITPSMEVFTAEEWMERYPVSKIDGFELVIGGGKINGNMCMELDSFLDDYRARGYEFPEDATPQECLDLIEQYEQEEYQKQIAAAQQQTEVITPEERIAAALEAQVLLSMPDVEE